MKITNLIFFFFAITFSSFSQTYQISSDFSPERKINNYTKFYVTDTILSLDKVSKISDNNWKKHKVKYGVSFDNFWLKVSVNNSTNALKEFYLSVDNLHLNKVKLFEVKQDTLIKHNAIGDLMPFKNRAVNHEKILFEVSLKPNEVNTYYVHLFDNRGTTMTVPLELWNKKDFYKNNNNYNISNTITLSISAFVILIAILCFLFFNEKVYLVYAAYVASFFLLVFSDRGYLYTFITHNTPVIHAYIRMMLAPLYVICLGQLTAIVFNLKENRKNLYKIINLIALFLVIYTLLEWLFFSTQWVQIPEFQKLKYLIMALVFLVYIHFVFKLRKEQKLLSNIYLLAYLPILIIGGIFSLKEMNLLTFNFPKIYFQYAFLFEILIIGGSIVYITKKNYERVSKLKLDILQTKQNLNKSLIDGIEKERERISSNLHDQIGSQLCVLRNDLSDIPKNQEFITSVNTIIDNVRGISHELSPNIFKKLGFETSVKSLIENAYKSSEINVNAHVLIKDNQLTDGNTFHIYRIIQELITNTLKHSKAQNVDVQIIMHDSTLNITFEDDGIGLSKNQKDYEGIGLINIKKRVEYLNGTIEITSQQNEGLFVMINIPI